MCEFEDLNSACPLRSTSTTGMCTLCRVPVGVSPGHHSTSGSGWVGWSIIQVGPPDAPFLSCGFTVPSSLHEDITQHWPGFLPVSASKASQCPPQCSLPCGLYVCFLCLPSSRLGADFCPSLQPLLPSAGIWQGKGGPLHVSMAKKDLTPQLESSREKHPCLQVSLK